MPAKKKPDLPSTLQRSPEKAQRTYSKTLESAEDTYDGNEERAHRTAFSALKHSFEKVGDHWEEKDEKGPSDPQAAKSGAAARKGTAKSYGGVDAEGSTKQELMEKARDADIPGRSKMDKGELADALRKSNDRATAKAREKG
ncbi:MAG: ChaB family protein [Actinomycetota bacterium]|nr:ChaB family protein [Actinomycetota bacterium]